MYAIGLFFMILCLMLAGCSREVPPEVRQKYAEISKKKIEGVTLIVEEVYCDPYAFQGEKHIRCSVSTTIGLVINLICGVDQGNSCRYSYKN